MIENLKRLNGKTVSLEAALTPGKDLKAHQFLSMFGSYFLKGPIAP